MPINDRHKPLAKLGDRASQIVVMEPEYKILGVFFLGAFAQFSLLSRFWKSCPGASKKLVSCFLLSLVVFLPWDNEPKYTFSTHLMYSIVVFSCSSAWSFRKEILPKIDEQSILQMTIVVWYFFIINSDIAYHLYLGLFSFSFLFHVAILLCITVSTLFIAITPYRLKPLYKVCFYIYFLLALIYLSVPNIKFIAQTIQLVDSMQFDKVSLLDTLISGSFCFYLLAHVVYISMLVPFKQSWKEVKEYAGLIANKYDDTQLHVRDTILIIIVQSGSLLLNYYFKIVNEFIMIYLSIVLMQFLVSQKHRMQINKSNRQA